MKHRIEILGKGHDRSAFDCGVPELDAYLRTQAGQDARRFAAAPYVLCEQGQTRVIGYYTLSTMSIDLVELPQTLATRLPRYPVIPAILIGRLALDRRFHGQGLGEHLLLDALHRCARQAHVVAAAAVVVEAMHDKAAHFYRHYDFTPFPDSPRRLFIPMQTIIKLFPKPNQ
ncbi:GNAT family N-acetyltransferase [Desulfonatronum sp. SC1]|uniref:GNAT family N-acetyltransferase n=1 Tax=Desulfonatronum sp. SC1 TaxID=2109626 RepID=UPI000D31EF17|nr:GNAT family N-acetyltransferase [Desulfonatronum sp. SC1]PTN37547.1 GNAT family N-acetyltransferase [Desulfonatronum sp. SC1]